MNDRLKIIILLIFNENDDIRIEKFEKIKLFYNDKNELKIFLDLLIKRLIIDYNHDL